MRRVKQAHRPSRNRRGIPVTIAELDPHVLVLPTEGAFDRFSWIDGVCDLMPHIGFARVPQGAPLVVSGWAVDPSSADPPQAVAIVVDRARVHHAEAGLDRTDVRALLGPETARDIGFRATVRIDDLLPGNHELRAYVLGADGTWYEAAYTPFSVYASVQPALDVASGRSRIVVDSVSDVSLDGKGRGPSDGIVARGHLALLAGWALNLETKTAPVGVCAMDGDGNAWSASCDLARPDVRASAGAAAEYLGFELLVLTEQMRLGSQVLSLHAFDANGRRYGSALEVELDVSAPMEAFPGFAPLVDGTVTASVVAERGSRVEELDGTRALTRAVGDFVPIEGWAFGNPTVGWRGEQLYLELQPEDLVMPPMRYQPRYGYTVKRPRKELRTPPHANGWFAYRLDTANLVPGSYAMRLALVARDRCSYRTIPLGTLRMTQPSSSGTRAGA